MARNARGAVAAMAVTFIGGALAGGAQPISEIFGLSSPAAALITSCLAGTGAVLAAHDSAFQRVKSLGRRLTGRRRHVMRDNVAVEQGLGNDGLWQARDSFEQACQKFEVSAERNATPIRTVERTAQRHTTASEHVPVIAARGRQVRVAAADAGSIGI